MLNFGGNLVVNNGLLILADNINSQLQSVILADLVRFGLAVFRRQPIAIDKCTIG